MIEDKFQKQLEELEELINKIDSQHDLLYEFPYYEWIIENEDRIIDYAENTYVDKSDYDEIGEWDRIRMRIINAGKIIQFSLEYEFINENNFESVRLASDISKKYWNYCSIILNSTDDLLMTSEEVGDVEIVDGNTVLKSGSKNLSKTPTEYNSRSFKVMGDLLNCIAANTAKHIQVLCYLTFLIEMMRGILDTLSQFVKLVNIDKSRNTTKNKLHNS